MKYWYEKHIEKLEAENKRLREALEDICKYWEYDDNGDDQDILLEIAVDKAKIILEGEADV